MNLDKELLEVHSEINQRTLNEGLVFFKDSKRLKKLSKKIAVASFKAAGREGYKEVEEIVEKLENISIEFLELERKYKASSKEEKSDIKSDYKILSQKFEELIRIINQQTFKALLRAGFNLALIAAPIVFTFAQLNSVGSSVDTLTDVHTRDTAVSAANYGSNLRASGHRGLDNEKVKYLMSTLNMSRREAELEAMSNAMTAGGDRIIGGPSFSELGAPHASGVMAKVREAFAKTLGFIGLMRVFEMVTKNFGSTALTNKTRDALKNLKEKQITDYE